SQIRNIWKQWPPDWEWRLRYGAFLVPLLAVYLVWVFVVLGSPFRLIGPGGAPIDASEGYQRLCRHPVLHVAVWVLGLVVSVVWSLVTGLMAVGGVVLAASLALVAWLKTLPRLYAVLWWVFAAIPAAVWWV